jgi:hypothetical protein
MSPGGTTGGEVAPPTSTQATLDTWFHVQNHRRRLLRRGHRSVRYYDNSPTPQSATTYSNRQGTQLYLMTASDTMQVHKVGGMHQPPAMRMKHGG